MAQPDRRLKHHQLWVGYALIVAVIVLMVLAVNSAMQAKALRQKTTNLDGRISSLTAEHQHATKLLSEQQRENLQQDGDIAEQKRRLLRQESAIARLARLRKQDSNALTSLHNELAVHHTTDARIKQRLQQLEANNAAARNVINATPPPIGDKVQQP
jgi:chromosome segregation ATPase